MDSKYTSVFMYEDSSKEDIESFKKDFKIIVEKDIYLYIFIAGAILSFVLLIFIPYFLILTVLFLALIMWRIRTHIFAKREAFLKAYEAYLVKNTPDGYTQLSAIYPSYIKSDNKNRNLMIFYRDKDYAVIPYDDIVSYEILIDKVSLNSTRLPEKPDPRIRSYVIAIKCKSGHRVEIGYSNANRYLKFKRGYVFQQFANSISINKIATTIDKILRKK